MSGGASSSGPLRVLFVAPRLGSGGMARYLVELAGALVEKGCVVRVVTVAGEGIERTRGALEGSGAEVVIAPRLTRRVLRREVRGHRAEVVKLFTGAFPPDTRVSLRLAGMGVAMVESIHSVPRRTGVRLGQRVFYRLRRTRRYGAVVFDGETERLMRGTSLAGCVHRVRYGMRLPEAGVVARGDDEFRFVTVCRLDERVKDVSTLLRAFAEVREGWDRSGRRRARLTVVGDGPDLRALRRLAADLGLRNRVTFAGWVEDPVRILREADVFVLSTRRESVGRVNVEAAAVGLPVIASRVAGCRESVSEGESGILVEPGDVRALADAMLRVAGDGGLRARLGGRGPGHASQFEMGAHAARLLEVMRGVCARG